MVGKHDEDLENTYQETEMTKLNKRPAADLVSVSPSIAMEI
jgi:hypothetical protein